MSPNDSFATIADDNESRLSKFYFTVIQILRIASGWIQESTDDLRRTVDDMERLYFLQTADEMATFLPSTPEMGTRDAAIQTFKQNWESVILDQQRRAVALLSRIAVKQEEIVALRADVSLVILTLMGFRGSC